MLVTVLLLIQHRVWVGVVFFCFNLLLATKSFVSAAAQQATTALMVGKKSLHIISVVMFTLVMFLWGHLSLSQASKADSSLAVTTPTWQVLH